MKLKAFTEKESKKKTIYVCISCLILLLSAILIYRTYSIYQEQQEFDVIRGNVPDQNYDALFSFTIEDETGNKRMSNTIPEGKDYKVTIECTNGATGSWDNETWGPIITNLTTSRTKCYINFLSFKESPTSTDVIKSIPTVTNGNGLYEVPHGTAEITFTDDDSIINNLKQTELRFAGANPNNYVTFNEETAGWRIIGLVNTPEGQRIKLVKDSSIGRYSWDSTGQVNSNHGMGINEWSTSALKSILNDGPYYNRENNLCYGYASLGLRDCNFSNNGLLEQAKNMIDIITWNTGSSGEVTINNENGLASHFYNYERSNKTGKYCSNDTLCNDTVERTTSWKGQIALMYPSDYGYATSGGKTQNRDWCLNQSLASWHISTTNECLQNNWIFKENIDQWTLTPYAATNYATQIHDIASVGFIENTRADGGDLNNAVDIYPSVYLKLNVKISEGEGTKANPYQLVS